MSHFKYNKRFDPKAAPFRSKPYKINGHIIRVCRGVRDYTKDSRFWGFVPGATITGVVQRVCWSWDRDAHRVRWERIGKTC